MEEKVFRSKNSTVLRDFSAYCKAHPEFRFWQALRNWSRYGWIEAVDPMGVGDRAHLDTFYWEGKRHNDDDEES